MASIISISWLRQLRAAHAWIVQHFFINDAVAYSTTSAIHALSSRAARHAGQRHELSRRVPLAQVMIGETFFGALDAQDSDEFRHREFDCVDGRGFAIALAFAE